MVPDWRRMVSEDGDIATTTPRATTVDVVKDAAFAVAVGVVVATIALAVVGDDVNFAAATPPPMARKAVAVQTLARLSRLAVERYTVTPQFRLRISRRVQRAVTP